ncbi:MAG: hypothetical protein KME05_17835 [Gloeocapsa sp. UFS-A4-WI-NPMV-4B04]|nr:hypothetical protein [Gloeocapsa sp. UFS-A4-WI-NPMV-4B04]
MQLKDVTELCRSDEFTLQERLFPNKAVYLRRHSIRAFFVVSLSVSRATPGALNRTVGWVSDHL